MYGIFPDAFNAVTLALIFMIAYKGTDHRQGIIFKKHLSGFHHSVFLKKPDHLGDIGPDGTAFLPAPGVLAL